MTTDMLMATPCSLIGTTGARPTWCAPGAPALRN
jgi:hypothetical protein